MSEATPQDSLPYDLLCQVDVCCDEFESAWEQGNEPACESAIEDLAEEAKRHALCELLLIEWQRRLASQGANAAREALENRHSLADALDQHSLSLDEVLKQADSDSDKTALFTPSNRQLRSSLHRHASSGALHLRCPHCQNGVELLADAPLEEITCASCGSTFGLVGADGEALATPTKIDRFLLLEKIGIGGFGTVWRALDPELDREVAIKVPRRSQLSRHEAELFFREARAAAQLSHPNIVPVHEVGRDASGAIYIVSDLVRGISLAEWLKHHRLTVKQAAKLTSLVCEALEYAHQRGIVHRDLKPSNLMLELPKDKKGQVATPEQLGPDEHGKPYLMDFGLAKRDVGEITMTIEGQVLGTPAYMSPEQAGGQAKWIDRRSDLYSLGVMLFQLLTGELPFRGTAQSQIKQRLEDDAPPARRFSPSVPLDLATICAKCLERDPNKRYNTAGEVEAELRRFLNGEPVLARPLSRFGRTARWAKRYPARATALALGGFLAVAGPTAAVVINSQRSEIEGRLNEIQQLVKNDEQKIDQLNLEKAALENRVAISEKSAAARDIHSSRKQFIRKLLDSKQKAWLGELEELDAKDPKGATARIGLAQLALSVDRTDEAKQWLTEAVEIFDKENPDDLKQRRLHAEGCYLLSLLLAESGDQKQALSRAKQSMEIRRKLVKDSDSSTESLLDLSMSMASRRHLITDPERAKEVRQELASTIEEGTITKQIADSLDLTVENLYETSQLLTE